MAMIVFEVCMGVALYVFDGGFAGGDGFMAVIRVVMVSRIEVNPQFAGLIMCGDGLVDVNEGGDDSV